MMIRYLCISLLLLLGATTTLSAQGYQDWIDQSFECSDVEDWVGAEECLKRALRLEPGNPQNAMLLNNLGSIQRRRGHLDEALQSYATGLLFAPRSTAILMNRAGLFLDMDSVGGALDDYSTILQIEPNSSEALYARGMLLMEQNDTIGAAKDFKHMLKQNPNSSKARIGLASLNTQMGAFKEAERLYSIVLSVNPRDPDLYFRRAEMYFLWGKYVRSLEDLKLALDYDPDNALIYLLRGKNRLKLYERRQALMDFTKAKELGFNDPIVDEYIKLSK
ncbi:MAG: tetratricopeptide repeat protein [Bacteroidales bacterium]